jgi:hypothetical protein
MLHQAHGLAISTGCGHPKIAGHIFFGVAPFLMAKQQHRSIAQSAYATDQSLVVITAPVAMQFNPVVAEHLDKVQRARSVGMTSNLDFLGWR